MAALIHTVRQSVVVSAEALVQKARVVRMCSWKVLSGMMAVQEPVPINRAMAYLHLEAIHY